MKKRYWLLVGAMICFLYVSGTVGFYLGTCYQAEHTKIEISYYLRVMEREIKNVQVNHFRFYSLPLIIFGTIVYFTSERQYKKYLTEIHKNLEQDKDSVKEG